MALKFHEGLGLGVFTIVLLLPCTDGVNHTSDYERLYTALTKGYNKQVFPASVLPVSVDFNLGLHRILELYESRETLYLDMYITMGWNDIRLSWDRTEFSNISKTKLSSAIWTPDITLYNSGRSQSPVSRGAGAIVYYSGMVYTVQKSVLTSHCSLDLRRFPFDTQQCDLKFASWLYAGDIINLTSSHGVTMKDYIVNREWDVVEVKGGVQVTKYECCPETYPYFQMNITMRRRPGLFTFMYVSPAVLFSLLTPMLFIIPPTSGERTTIGGALLICLLLLLQLLNFNLPPTHIETPILGIYYTCTMVFVGLAVGLSAFVMNVKTRSGRQNGVPSWLRKVTLGPLKRIVCLDRDNFRPYGNLTSSGERTGALSAVSETSHHKMENPAMVALESEVRDLVKQLKTYNQIRERRQLIEDIVSDWQDVVLVVDRVLFLVFLAIDVITTMCMFL